MVVWGKNIIIMIENYKKTFLADATSATISGILGSSPSTVVVESGVGIAQGARSGLTAIFVWLNVSYLFYFLIALNKFYSYRSNFSGTSINRDNDDAAGSKCRLE